MDSAERIAAEMVRVMRFPDRSTCLCVGEMRANVTPDLAEALANTARVSIATALRTAVAAERDLITGPVRVLVEALPKCPGHYDPHGRERQIPCGKIATRDHGPGLVKSCDEHAPNSPEFSYAPALRAVLAMLDGGETRAGKVERVVEAARVYEHVAIHRSYETETDMLDATHEAGEKVIAAVQALDGVKK